jgi:hypothetical protein
LALRQAFVLSIHQPTYYTNYPNSFTPNVFLMIQTIC